MFKGGERKEIEIDWDDVIARQSAMNWFESGDTHAIKVEMDGEVYYYCAIAVNIERRVKHLGVHTDMAGNTTRAAPIIKYYLTYEIRPDHRRM